MDVRCLQTFCLADKDEMAQLVVMMNNRVYYTQISSRVQVRSSLTIDVEEKAIRVDDLEIKKIRSEDFMKVVKFIDINQISKHVKIIKARLSSDRSVTDSPMQSDDACAFVDKDGSLIEFELDSKGRLRMTCDDTKIGDPKLGVQKLEIDDKKGEIFDGEEIIPILPRDRKRVFSWFCNIKDRLSTCEIYDANCCEFKDEEGTEVKFLRRKNRVQEWCDGVTIIDKIERLTLDRDGGVILDQQDELIPIPVADRDRVFAWIQRVFKELRVDLGYAKLVERDGSDVDLTNIVTQKRKSPGRFVQEKKKKKSTRRALIEESTKKSKSKSKKESKKRARGSDTKTSTKKKSKKSIPSLKDSKPEHFVGYVFEELDSGELFAVLESREQQNMLRYASLTPDPTEAFNTFEGVLNEGILTTENIRIVREATREEMDKAKSLWKREHPPKALGLLSCLFVDARHNVNIEIEVENGQMDIIHDRKITIEHVTRLVMNEDLGTIGFFNNKKQLLTKVRTKDRTRVYKCLRQYALLASLLIEEEEKEKDCNNDEMDVVSSDEDEIVNEEEEEEEKRKSWKGQVFEETNPNNSNSTELFVCIDQNETTMKYASLTPVENDQNTFSVPNENLWNDENIRLVRSASSDEMKFAQDLWKKERDNVEDDVSTRLEFMDMDGTRMMFKVTPENKLEEWCDGSRQIKSVRSLKINRKEGTILDQENELIPIKRADRERVFEWILNVMTNLNLGCENKIEFVDAEDCKVQLIVRCDDRLEEWCDGDCVIENVRSLTLDRDGGVLRDDDGAMIPILKDDRRRVFDWIIDISTKISGLDLGYAKLVRQDGSDVDSSNVVTEARQSPFKRLSPSPSSQNKTMTKNNYKNNKNKSKKKNNNLPSFTNVETLPEYVFEETDTGELFVVLCCVGSEVRYASLTPVEDDSNTFCRQSQDLTNNLVLRILRRANTGEIKQAAKLWKDEHPSCAFVDRDGTEIEFVVVNNKLEEWCDGNREIESIKTLKLNRTSGTVHDGEELIPVRSKDVKRLFEFLESLNLSSLEVVVSSDSNNRKEKKVTFKDHEGSKIEFIFKKNGTLCEICDGKVVQDSVKSIRLNRTTRTVHDGDEIMKLRSAKDTDRVLKFFKDVVVGNKCNVVIEEKTPVIKSTKKKKKKKTVGNKCVFIDAEGSEIEFVVVKNQRLEEWCDGKREIESIKMLTLNRTSRIIDDGEESIPVPEVDVERVFTFLETLNVLNCTIVREDEEEEQDDVPRPDFEEEDDLLEEVSSSSSSSSQKPYPSTQELYQRPSGKWVARLHKDESGRGKTTQLGVYSSQESALKKWQEMVPASVAISPVTVCNIAQISTSSSSSSSLQISPPQIVSKNSNRFATTSTVTTSQQQQQQQEQPNKDECEFLGSYRNKFRLAIRGGVLEECRNDERLEGALETLRMDTVSGAIYDGTETFAVCETDRERVERWLRDAQSRVTCDITIVSETSNSKCSFTDEDGTLIEFVVNGTNLEEWVDGEREFDNISQIIVMSGRINDGDEDIPVRQRDRERVFAWLKRVQDDVTCDIAFIKKEFVPSSRMYTHDGDTYYGKLKLGDDIISEGDFVKVKLQDPETVDGEDVDVHIAQVVCMWEDIYKEMWIEHRWFYYPESTRLGRLSCHHRYEILETDHVEENVVDVIQAKVNVVPEDSPDVELDSENYLCHLFYSPHVGLVKKISGKDRTERGLSYSRRRSMDHGVYHTLRPDDSKEKDDDEDDDDDAMDVETKSSSGNENRGLIVNAESVFSDACRRLQLSAIPPSLPCREKERESIEGFIREAIESAGTRTASSLYISGLPGTGKTATVLEVIRRLHREQKSGKIPPFRFLEINAMRLKHPRDVYSQVWRFIGPRQSKSYVEGSTTTVGVSDRAGEEFSHYREWGHYKTAIEAAQMLTQTLSKPCPKRQFAVILVDELDFLKTKDQKVLYNLLEWPTWRHSRLLVVGIANTMDLPERLLPKLSSRLALQRIVFKPYNRDQIEKIVSTRLRDLNAFSNSAIEICARKVSSISGDVRRALQICRRAAENRLFEFRQPRRTIATTTTTTTTLTATTTTGLTTSLPNIESTTITDITRPLEISDVTEAVKELSQGHMTRAICDASTYERILLVALSLKLEENGVESIEFVDVYGKFRSICVTHSEVAAHAVPGPEQVLRMCERLAESNILLLPPSREFGNRVPRVELNCQCDDVAWALQHDSHLSTWIKYN